MSNIKTSLITRMLWRAEEWMVVSPSEIAVPAQQSGVSGFSGMGLVHNYML